MQVNTTTIGIASVLVIIAAVVFAVVGSRADHDHKPSAASTPAAAAAAPAPQAVHSSPAVHSSGLSLPRKHAKPRPTGQVQGESASAYSLRLATMSHIEEWATEYRVTDAQLSGMFDAQRDAQLAARAVERDALDGLRRAELSQDEYANLLQLGSVEADFDRALSDVLTEEQINGLLSVVGPYYLLLTVELSD
jgi:hypothetical protein